MQMRTIIVAVTAMLLAAGAAQAAIIIDTVPVGNLGNATDTRYAATGSPYYGNGVGYGAVSYAYNIGKYEVTAGQYTAFLNAVAKTDTYALYNTNMDTANYSYACNIKRSGSPGSYVYTVGTGTPQDVTNWANRPVNLVSFWDSCRFANWLTNGQPTGAQVAGTTERGAYTLDGYNGDDGRTIQRNANATWAVTSEDEWYKAAYYDPNKSGGAGYWGFPTRSNTAPSNSGGDGYTDPGNHANFLNSYGGCTIGNPYCRTNAGEFENSASAYGTFDQGGNVWEWNEAIPYQVHTYADRCLRGGGWDQDVYYLQPAYWVNDVTPAGGNVCIGFRVSEVPEPASMTFLALGGIGLLRRRRGLKR